MKTEREFEEIGIQYPFRLSQGGKVLLGSRDMHVPRVDLKGVDFSYGMYETSALNALILIKDLRH